MSKKVSKISETYGYKSVCIVDGRKVELVIQELFKENEVLYCENVVGITVYCLITGIYRLVVCVRG